MHSTLFALPQHDPFQPRTYSSYSSSIYPPSMTSTQSSYLRSSVGRPSRPQGYPNAYPSSYVQAEDDDMLVTGTPSSAGSVSSMVTNCSSQDQVQGYTVQSEYDLTSTSSQPYAVMDLYPRTKQWASGALHALHHDYSQPHFETQSLPVSFPASTPLQQTAQFNRAHFQISSTGMPVLSNFETNPSDSFMTSYGTVSRHNSHATARTYSNPGRVGTSPAATYPFQQSFSPQQVAAQEYVQQISVEQPPTFQLPSPVDTHSKLAYPSSSESPPQFVSLSEVSPSPTISPKLLLQHISSESAANATPTASAPYNGTERTNSSVDGEYEVDEDTTFVQGSPNGRSARGTRSVPTSSPKKRRRKVSYTSSEDSDGRSSVESDSGESEFMKDDESADEDDEYTGPQVRRRSVRRCTSVIETSTMPSPRRIPIPIPVPNLTKKSRGRRVPTVPVTVTQDGVLKVSVCFPTLTLNPH